MPPAHPNLKQPAPLLGRICPAILLMCFVLDVTLRFLPPELVSFRAWEPMKSFYAGSGAFGPNRSYNNPGSYGDLANMGNLPHLRHYHREVFHTDNQGYRNAHNAAKPWKGILVVGDSFAASSGVSDEDSFGGQLALASTFPVYNAGGGEAPLAHIPMACGLVIFEQSERKELPDGKPVLAGDSRPSFLNQVRQGAKSLRDFASSGRLFSPVQIWASRAMKSAQNDKVLPNPYQHLVESRRLLNGEQMLILRSEVENYRNDHRPINPAFLVELRNRLEARGIGLLVVLVPDKYAVYHDYLQSADPPRLPHTDAVEARLISAGIPVINLRPMLQERAAQLLSQKSYVYRLDDTHWNETGIALSARAIVQSGVFPKTLCAP